jgi:uncharacterized membrane protein YkgB
LVLVLGWIGAMKFTAYEATGIQGLVASSPLMSWLYKAACKLLLTSSELLRSWQRC